LWWAPLALQLARAQGLVLVSKRLKPPLALAAPECDEKPPVLLQELEQELVWV
jgi:hypothetical protein